MSKNCLIQIVDQRMVEAHHLWHQTESHYNNPDNFRTYLNATIQSLRNVTFILQSQKSKIKDFDAWYKKWREKMKDDPKLKWLHNARTKVVKQGDLETKSMAKVRFYTWDNYEFGSLELSPKVKTKRIAQIIAKAKIPGMPSDLRNYGIIEIERRWVVVDMPNDEVLDILTHCYIFLRSLVIDAHRKIGSKCKQYDRGKHAREISRIYPRVPACMYTTKDSRSVRISIKTKKQVKYIIAKPFTKENKRYAQRKHKNPIQELDFYNTQAISLLKKYKCHIPILLLWLPNGKVGTVYIETKTREDRFVVWRDIADFIKQNNIEGIIFISETWVSNNYKKGLPSEDPKRAEGLIAIAAESNGLNKTFCTTFSRTKNDEIIIEKTEEIKEAVHSILEPIFEVWGKQQ